MPLWISPVQTFYWKESDSDIHYYLIKERCHFCSETFHSRRLSRWAALFPPTIILNHENRNPKLLNPTPETQDPKPQIPNSKPHTCNLQPQTPNPKPQTSNPKPRTPNPKSQTLSQVQDRPDAWQGNQDRLGLSQRVNTSQTLILFLFLPYYSRV